MLVSVWLVAVGFLSSGAPQTLADDGAASPPNIVLIMADDLGYEALSCYGGESYRTPHLDELARTGMRFTHAYAQPLCTNTRLQLMTGRYNHRNWVAFGILDPRERTIGHFMQDAGYATCIAGKWQLTSYDPPDYPGAELRRGLGMPPAQAGFDEYSLWHTGHTENKGSRYADPVIEQNGQFRRDLEGRYGEDVWCEYIGDFMERHRDRPFFVYYPMALTHGPFVPTPLSDDWHTPSKRHNKDTAYFPDMVEYMDACVGRIIGQLERLDLRRKTLVLFYADNGTPREITSRFAGRSIAGGKGDTTDAGTRVPLIANWPGTTPAGAVNDSLVDSTDFVPTCVAAAGGELPRNITFDGRSFLPQLNGEKGDPRKWVFFHYDPRPGWDKDKFRLHRFAQTQRFKLYSDGRLYEVATDELEQHPILPRDDTDASRAARRLLRDVIERMADVPNDRADAAARALGQ